MNANNPPKSKGLPKIGKRGWCGVVMVFLGFITFIGANKSASDIVQTNFENRGLEGVMADNALSQAAGEGSYSDFLAEQNRKSGFFCAGIGGALVVWGYRRYNPKKISSSQLHK